MSNTITFKFENKEPVVVIASDGDLLLDVARKNGIAIDAPCAGNGTCGKCLVKLIEGTVDSDRNRHLADDDYLNGLRLACISRVDGDASISIPSSATDYQKKIKISDSTDSKLYSYKQDYVNRGYSSNLAYKIISVSLSEPSIDDQMADRERFLSQISDDMGINSSDIGLTLSALRELPELMRDSDYKFNVLMNNNIIMRVSKQEILPIGIAIDIGTTSVSALLVNLTNGDIILSANAGNAQIRYGADVIHRIIESSKHGGMNQLQNAITEECLKPLISELCAQAGFDSASVLRASITGNTTMIHFLLGIYANYLRMEPYIPAFFHPGVLRGADLRIGIHDDADVIIAPSVGSYVGGDITAGTFASAIADSDELSLFIDLGTNGEIVLGNRDYLMTCACSAGPAFEGGDIGCGMRATDGAIDACVIDEKTMTPRFSVIGKENEPPRGICGSGLIDIIAELFRSGIVDAKGKFAKENDRIVTDEWGITSFTIAFPKEAADGRAIVIDDADIDNFIRAKASIFSAIRTMLDSIGAEPSDIENVYIAGGIGSGIDFDNAVSIGMLPDIPIEKYSYIGNSSLSGAYAALINSDADKAVNTVASEMTYIELSAYPGYMDEFIAACFLPHTDASLFSKEAR